MKQLFITLGVSIISLPLLLMTIILGWLAKGFTFLYFRVFHLTHKLVNKISE